MGFVKRIIIRCTFQQVLNFSSQWDHMKMNYFYVITFMFCSDTLTVQQLSLRTSQCYCHLSFRFLPPRDTHTIISMDYCPMAIIHIPVHTVWAQTPHPDMPSGLQNSPHLWQLHPESSHNLTGPARVSVFDYFLAKGKGQQRLDLLISPALGICAHGIWQPKGPCMKQVPVLPWSQARTLQRYYVLLTSFFWI